MVKKSTRVKTQFREVVWKMSEYTLAKSKKKLADYWNNMARIYLAAHPTVLDVEGRVITCNGKWYYEKFRKKGLTWDPCEGCSHRAKCVEWEGIEIWKKK